MRLSILSILTFLVMNLSSANAASSTVQSFLNQHFQELAQKQLDSLLPKGKFTVQATVILKAQNPGELQTNVRLPMGLTPFQKTDADVETAIQSGPESLFPYIEKVMINLSLSSDVNSNLRAFLTQSLKTSLRLSSDRGDEVVFQDLPAELTQMWTLQSGDSNLISPQMIFIAGTLIVLFILGALLFSFLLKRMSVSLTAEAKQISTSLKELVTEVPASRFGGGGPGGNPFQNQNNGSLVSEDEAAMANAAKDQESFWAAVETDAIRMFCLDCLADPVTRKFPGVLLNLMLPAAKSDELFKRFETENINLPPLEGETINPKDVLDLFRSGQAEYRRNARSPLSKLAARVPMERLEKMTKDEEDLAAVLLINALTPIRRGALTKSMGLDLRMKLSMASQKKVSVVDHKKVEWELSKSLEKWAGKDTEEPSSITMGHLSGVLMEVNSFEEDEALYLFSLTNPKARYDGPLLALNQMTSEIADQIEVQTLALATFGYARETVDKVAGKLSGKRKDWFLNFVEKLRTEAPSYQASNLKTARQTLSKLLNEPAKKAA